jgi:hypothetical protein
VGKTDDSTSLKSTPLIEAERQVESFRQVREAHRMELVEDYVELISDLLADGGEARQVDIATWAWPSPPWRRCCGGWPVMAGWCSGRTVACS